MSFPGLAHRMETVGARSAACASSTTARPPTPTPRARRCPAIRKFYWIAGGQPEDRRHRRPGRPLRPRRQGLSDRRGRGRRSPRRWRARRPTRPVPGPSTPPSRQAFADAAADRPGRRSCCSRRPAPPSTSSPTSRPRPSWWKLFTWSVMRAGRGRHARHRKRLPGPRRGVRLNEGRRGRRIARRRRSAVIDQVHCGPSWS